MEKEPCIDCKDKEIDEYGYVCDLSCGKRTAWFNYMHGYTDAMKDEESNAHLGHVVESTTSKVVSG